MTSISLPSKMTFMTGLKNLIASLVNADKKLRHNFPKLWKNNKGLILGMLISAGMTAFISEIPEESDAFLYGALLLIPSFLFYFVSLFMVSVRVIQGTFSEQGYMQVGWKGIKWSIRETRMLGYSALFCIFMIVGSVALLGSIYLFYVLLNGFPLDFELSKFRESNYFLPIISITILIAALLISLLYSRIIFFSVFAVANLKKPFKESMILTRNHKAYAFWSALVCGGASIPISLDNAIKSFFEGYSLFIRSGVNFFVGLCDIAFFLFLIYVTLEIFQQLATADLKKEIEKAF